MRYVIVAMDPDDLLPGLSRNYGDRKYQQLTHAIARTYEKYWCLHATAQNDNYITSVETLNSVDLPVPIFERKSIGNNTTERTRRFHVRSVDVSYLNGLVIIKFK